MTTTSNTTTRRRESPEAVKGLLSEYLTIQDIMRRFACSRMWVHRHTLNHDFPLPIKFGDNVATRRRWRRDDVEAWEAQWVIRSTQHPQKGTSR